ncbi:hypothetical protein [Rubinisphaera italica]|uniref:Uncharacterized protein n=1 Tax=Rubinisphaera italica TaxID=2527969 RepID=A0A5C5XFA1_9PLAN|nr:hypothetical protein [Rubinisphaera italica]TWT60825.1 hypothetical protein Pan54_15520 [Rubinisphaera italica]
MWLAEHPVSRVQRVLEQQAGPEPWDAERIIQRVQQSRSCESTSLEAVRHDDLQRPEVLSIQVPTPDLNHFDHLSSLPSQRMMCLLRIS